MIRKVKKTSVTSCLRDVGFWRSQIVDCGVLIVGACGGMGGEGRGGIGWMGCRVLCEGGIEAVIGSEQPSFQSPSVYCLILNSISWTNYLAFQNGRHCGAGWTSYDCTLLELQTRLLHRTHPTPPTLPLTLPYPTHPHPPPPPQTDVRCVDYPHSMRHDGADYRAGGCDPPLAEDRVSD